MNKVFPLLLAEDEENDVFFLEHAFQKAQIANPLHIVRDGQEAIEYLAGTGKFSDRVQHPLPGLLILDLKMPRKTGLEVLRWLQVQPVLSRLPTIVWSTSVNLNDIDKAYQYGANAFIAKPASMEATTELARLIKGFWLTFNEPPVLHREVSPA
jgi:CheY-like chemotaxis protein